LKKAFPLPPLPPLARIPLAVGVEVHDQPVALRVVYQRAHGHADDDVLRLSAGLLLASALFSALGKIVLLVPEVDERAELAVGQDDDVASFAAVAAVGSAARHIRLAPEADATLPSVARFNVYFDPVYKIGHCWTEAFSLCFKGLMTDLNSIFNAMKYTEICLKMQV
jgi:hypothetical protein